MSRKHAVLAGVGLTLSMAVGSPALADDTELLVANPNSTGAARPNILFILDSSGSMQTIERTQEPYNAAIDYPGSCQSDQYYWTTSNNAPECNADNNQRIDQDQFLCAQGLAQMATAGSYTDTMTQYRRRNGNWRWRTIRRDNNGIVECENDSGTHGEGVAGQVYAQIGSNLAPFTDDPDREVAWGSSPTDRTFTIYDPNRTLVTILFSVS